MFRYGGGGGSGFVDSEMLRTTSFAHRIQLISMRCKLLSKVHDKDEVRTNAAHCLRCVILSNRHRGDHWVFGN